MIKWSEIASWNQLFLEKIGKPGKIVNRKKRDNFAFVYLRKFSHFSAFRISLLASRLLKMFLLFENRFGPSPDTCIHICANKQWKKRFRRQQQEGGPLCLRLSRPAPGQQHRRRPAADLQTGDAKRLQRLQQLSPLCRPMHHHHSIHDPAIIG